MFYMVVWALEKNNDIRAKERKDYEYFIFDHFRFVGGFHHE